VIRPVIGENNSRRFPADGVGEMPPVQKPVESEGGVDKTKDVGKGDWNRRVERIREIGRG
jgi:hypothetical protein